MTTARQKATILLAFIAFISLGLPDGLLGVAWPSIRGEFGLSLDTLGILLIASTTGYIISSFLSGMLVRKLGIGLLLSASCALTGFSLLMYTLAAAWFIIPCTWFFLGLGAGAIDAGLNTYIENNHGEGLMQWLHASFGVGITSGPIIMTAGLTFLDSWRFGYRVVGIAQISLALCFFATKTLWNAQATGMRSIPEASNPLPLTKTEQTTLRQTLKQPSAWLCIAMFFLYTGIEISLGLWAYTLLTEARHIVPSTAGLLTGSFWAMFTIGRISAGIYTKRIPAKQLVVIGNAAALFGITLIIVNLSNIITMTGIAICGFAIAPMFPALVSTTSSRVGKEHINNTIGMQIAGAGIGSAVLPTLTGFVAKQLSVEAIPYCIFCFAFLLLLLIISTSSRKIRKKTF